jgi:phosphinothricin acetyltransferase
MSGPASSVDGPPRTTVRDAEVTDVVAITAIQNAFIGTSAIEWTDTPHDVEERGEWLAKQQAAGRPVLVAVVGGDVVGWASYDEFRDSVKWPGYRLTVEHTIHVREDQWGAGVGRMLMDTLLERARAAGLHAMVAAVDGENTASIQFHERLGFHEVARMPQVGTKFGRWLDLVLLQQLLDESAPPVAEAGPGGVVIRHAIPGDEVAIGVVHVRAWQAAYRGVMPDDYLAAISADERATMWAERIRRNDLPPVLVVEVDGTVAGFTDYGRQRPSPDAAEAGELYAINLDPAVWGRGIGRRLLRQVMDALRSLGYREAILWVVTQNTRARTLYESEGWRCDDIVVDDEVLGVTVTETRYRVTLG